MIRSIPAGVGDLNSALVLAEKNPKDADALFRLGLEYQKAGKGLKESALRSAFLFKSDRAFLLAKKNSSGSLMTEKADLYQLLNDIYSGRHKSAMKKLEKAGKVSNELLELNHFILALCYKLDGETEKYGAERGQISDSGFLAELDNIEKHK